jgi:hypothetical protein
MTSVGKRLRSSEAVIAKMNMIPSLSWSFVCGIRAPLRRLRRGTRLAMDSLEVSE